MVTPGEIYPLDAPGMPIPGYDFQRMVSALGDDEIEITGTGVKRQLVHVGKLAEELFAKILYANGYQNYRLTVRGMQRVSLPVVSGHIWDSDEPGPQRSDVMLIGKMLGSRESLSGRNLTGESGELLSEVVGQFADPEEYSRWYITNLMKTIFPDENASSNTLKATWIQEWLPFLHQELRLVRPKYILCLGADACKALLGSKQTLTGMEGRVVELTFPLQRQEGEPAETHTALVMAINNPAAVLAAPESEDKFQNGVARFVQLTRGMRWDLEEEGLDHRYVDTLEALRSLEYEIKSDCENNLLGVDAEWHGQHPQNKNAYLRSFQVSWRPKTGVHIAFYYADGKPVYEDPEEDKEARQIVMRICEGRQLAGHFFDADLEFLVASGLDLRPHYRAAETWPQYMDDVLSDRACGFDTGLAAHAANETDDFSLTHQALRYTTAPRYDMQLLEWKKGHCAEKGFKPGELEGYGAAPEHILAGVPQPDGRLRNSYSVYDADVARRLALVARERLCRDHMGHNCWEAMWISMRALPAVLEINCGGVLIDRNRLDELTMIYMGARNDLRRKIQTWANWPAFNIDSVFHVREFLFGEELNGHETEPGDPPKRLRPAGARSLRLSPIMSTDKRPMLWEDVVREGLTREKTPGTNKMSLSILAQDNQEVLKKVGGVWKKFDFSTQVNWIRDYRFISQVLKSSLRPPVIEKDDIYRRDDQGRLVYAGGVAAAICDDGRVRTHIYQTKETGRWSSARPSLHNWSKRREKDYKRILGPRYKFPLRTIMKAGEGQVLVEADYVGAELFGMAVMSGDPAMIEHVRRNQLPEDHPEHYDIHSNIAKMAFRLECDPTKAGLELIGKSHLRIVAKSVVFGVAYGRGAKAIALAAKEENVFVSVAEAQKVVDTIFEMYPRLVELFAECQSRATNERWLCNCFGRLRRFPAARELRLQGDLERQAMNFPIQGMIADAVSRAVDALVVYREQLDPKERWFDIRLQIHDALLFEVAAKDAAWLVDEVLPECMINAVPIYPTRVDGTPMNDPRAPYYLGIDTDVGRYWGELLYPDEFERLGAPPRLGGWRKTSDGWRHITKNSDSIWRDGAWHAVS